MIEFHTRPCRPRRLSPGVYLGYRHLTAAGAFLATDASDVDDVSSRKSLLEVAGDHRTLELRGAEAHRGRAPGQDQLDARKVSVAPNVVLPTALPTLHHPARLTANDGELPAGRTRQFLAFGGGSAATPPSQDRHGSAAEAHGGQPGRGRRPLPALRRPSPCRRWRPRHHGRGGHRFQQFGRRQTWGDPQLERPLQHLPFPRNATFVGFASMPDHPCILRKGARVSRYPSWTLDDGYPLRRFR